ncbi:MAG: hypothetical protein KDE51_26810, partial [Anaerolineales bacterium]|nr:hypothetical protein [Anaerolineales bacterium]
ENNVHLQQYARQLKEWLAQVTTTTRPQIYLDVRGSLGQLYNNNIGKILGAIFGLEYATKPYPLALVDPIFDEDPLGQRKRLSNLKQYLGFRKLKTEIWVRQTVKGLDEIEPLAQSGGVDGLQIDVLQWETLAKVIEGMQIGRAAGLPLTLILPPHIGPQEATFFYELAAAAQPNYLLLRGSIPQIYNLFKRQHHPAD